MIRPVVVLCVFLKWSKVGEKWANLYGEKETGLVVMNVRSPSR